MNEPLRRHGRLIAASLAAFLVLGLAFLLGSGGSAHARPARALVPVHAVAPALRDATVREMAVSEAAPSGPRHSRPTTLVLRHRSEERLPRGGQAAEAVALALKQATGLSLAQVTSRPVCGRPTAGHASCAAQTLVLRSTGAPVRPHIAPYRALGHVKRTHGRGARPANTSSPGAPKPDTPGYLQQAYDLTYLSQTGGAGDTVAVVDAYDAPTAEADLATYRSTYSLPACTTANGCFQKVGQDGSPSLPSPNASWEQEIALDLDAVSAICPQCHILLVEANSNSFADLQAAMQTAAGLGAKQISASWGGVSSGVPSVFRTFSGVATVAATGDYGYVGAGQDSYPAALPGVTAAGGTSLAPAGAQSPRGFGEAAWSWNGLTGGGSGCDVQFPRPIYQPAAGCDGRAYADLSADADPSTGLAVYDRGSWSVVGGTSLSTPLIAAYYAITGVAGATPRWAYGASGSLNDVVSGSSGGCASAIAYICNAGPGYDGPTGVGSISGAVVSGAPGIGGPAITSGSGNTYTQAVSAHGATIASGIYRNGLDTSWWIEYGTSSTYGQRTPATDIGAGSGLAAVTGYLSQLTPGTPYHYRIVAQNSLGTTYGYDYTFTTAVAQAGAPTAAFTGPTTATAPSAPVSFDASASVAPAGASISDYSWNFGDGTPAVDAGTTATASHTYTARGNYTVSLTVTSGNQTDTATHTVTIDDPPAAAFTPAGAAVPAGATIAFNANGSSAATGGSIADYNWNFGDGSPAVDGGAAASTGHTFTTPGTYTVTLTTTDDLNVMSTGTEQVTVAAFTASPAIPSPGSPVTFTAVGASPAGVSPAYIWDFGDGTAQETTSTPTVTHTYAARGPYNVTLTIQSGGTAAQTIDASNASTAALNVDSPPTAAFAPSTTTALPATAISFDANASSPPTGGTIKDYSWDFGDGTRPFDAGQGTTASHGFAAPGIYAITLTTTDDLGGTASAVQQVTVDQPTAAFAVASAGPAPGAPVTFDASGTSDPESTITDYSWDFGDGAAVQDAGANATAAHTFSTAGTYDVKLTVTNQLGQVAAVTRQVVVAPASTQSTTTSTPQPPAPTSTTTSTPAPAPPAPVASPTPPAPPSPPATTLQPSTRLSAKLAAAGRQRLSRVLGHGLRLALTVNQSARVSVQITIPHASKRRTKATMLLLRFSRTLGAGSTQVTLKLSRAAAGRLVAAGLPVLTVRVTLTGAAGSSQTRTIKIRLTR